MTFKVSIHKSAAQKGYAVMIDFYSETRSGKAVATYTTYVKTKKEADSWERKNKDWLINTAKNLTGV